MQQIEIKRKFFDVLETMGERSYKVSRKNNLYFLKDFGEDRKGFEDFVERTNKFKVCGVKSPKVYLYDKNRRIIVMDFIEGQFMDQYLAEKELDDDLYKALFEAYWFAKQDKIYLDFQPHNFILKDGKLFYIPFLYKRFENNNQFIQEDIKYWFYTEKLENYLLSRGFDFDHKKLKSDYEINKFMALVTIKYYR